MYNSIISTQVRDENEYLDEWIQYNLSIGFEHIVIYDNKSIVPVKRRWGNKVTILTENRDFESSFTDNCHFDTVKNFDANWIARIDVDEFIRLIEHTNINDLLEYYKEFGGLGINWRVFGTSGHKEKPEGLVRDNYLWRLPDTCNNIINGGNSHLKTIIKRDCCTGVPHPHYCWSTKPLVNEDYVPYIDAWTESSRKKVVIHHYITRSKAEWDAKFALWRHKYGLRSDNDFADIEKNCTVFDDSLKTK